MSIEIKYLKSNEIETLYLDGFINIPLIKGDKGDTGEQGIQGEKGDQGIQGVQGLKGDKGDTPIKGTDYFTEEEIQEIKSNILDQVNQFSVLVVLELPTENIDSHTIYFVPKTKSEQDDVYDEYIYINNEWEHIGTTEVDLNSYYKKEEIDKKLSEVKSKTIKCLQEIETPRPKSGTRIDISDSVETQCNLKISGNSVQNGEVTSNTPIEVESCGDNVNLLNYNNISQPAKEAGIKIDNDENIYDESPEGDNRTWNYNKSNYFVALNKGIYTVTLYFSKQASNASALLKILSETSEFYLGTCANKDKVSATFTLSEKTNVGIFFKIYDGICKVKLSEGTETGGYSRYNQGCIDEVICNKNILPYVEKVNSVIETGLDFYGITYFQKVKPSTTYTISTIENYSTGLQLYEYDDKKQFIRTIVPLTGNSFITSENTKYFKFRTNALVSNITNPKFMLSEGTLTDYKEHKSQIYTIPTQQPMRSIGDIRDTFVKKNNKWYERHYIARKIFNGTENWDYNAKEKIVYTQIDNNTQYGKNDEILVINNYLKSSTFNNHFKLDDIAFIWDTVPFVCIKATSKILGVETAKSWLKELYDSGNPLIIDRALITPTDTECTEEQSKVLFDIEQNAKTYDKVTHMYSTDKVSPNVEITYKKDIETLFANILIESGV